MEIHWTPPFGQVVLIEVLGNGSSPVLTGAVESDGPGPLVVNLGASPGLPAELCEVVASFFAPEALYLGRGTARRLGDPWAVELDVGVMQAVQRRSAARVPGRYRVALGAFDGLDDYVSVTGQTVDLAPGGCRVLVDDPLPDGAMPTVCIQLVDEPVVAQARVVDNREREGRWEYRLAFEDIDEPARQRLALLLA